jgi:hypothetical protein
MELKFEFDSGDRRLRGESLRGLRVERRGGRFWGMNGV